MIHYHGTPISGNSIDAGRFLTGRHAFVSFNATSQLGLVADLCSSFAIDNGAFSAWKQKRKFDFSGYTAFVRGWHQHPGFDWAVIPDVIDGTETDNDSLLAAWSLPKSLGVPVYHLHESIDRLKRLCDQWPRVALGSSGRWSDPGSKSWWARMETVMNAVTVAGKSPCKLHGLRMLDPKVFRYLPLASADSTNVGRNCGIDSRWTHAYSPASRHVRAENIADRIEVFNSAPFWEGTPNVEDDDD